MPKAQTTFDLFDLYYSCSHLQKEAYANFIFAVYSYDRNDRYVKLPTYVYDKMELIDKYCEVYKNQNRVPHNITDFLNLQVFGMKYKINRLKSITDTNCIKGIDNIIHPFLDGILFQSYDLYKLSCRFIKSLNFAELVDLVKSRFVENPVYEDEEEYADDEEEDEDGSETKSVSSSVTSEERNKYHKSLEEIIKMLDRHTPIDYKSTTTAVETVERKLEKNRQLLEKKDKKQKKADELDTLRKKVELLERQLAGGGAEV